MNNWAVFLSENKYIDFSSKIIQLKVAELLSRVADDVEKARIAYEFVRDEIPHSFDCNAKIITAKASDALLHKTGICHAKANLLAAFLRSQNIPTGFCFEHITLADDESFGYCVHAFNAVWLCGHWIKLDARGNKEDVNAQFSLDEPILAYPPRVRYDEYFYPGIYANPHKETMRMLEKAKCLQDIIDNIPDCVIDLPDME
ncbi:MAG: transglutaminase family protein [Oscillospiraceae bacterium]|nr:transglutaminase family protein [Oscillospiraceae bacterium]